MTPEGRVKDAIKAWLRQRDIWFCMPMGTGYGTSGVPDFVCCWRGRFLAIEAKAPGQRGRTTALQDKQIAGIQNAAGIALVVDNVEQLDKLEVDLGRVHVGEGL